MNAETYSRREHRRLTGSSLIASTPTIPEPHQVVTVASISHSIPVSFIANRLACCLNQETARSVLLVQLQSTPSSHSLRHWARTKPRLNGEFAFQKEVIEVEDGAYHRLKVVVAGGRIEAEYLPGFLAHLCYHFQHVVLQVGPDLPAPLLLGCLGESDKSFVLLQPTPEDFYHRELLCREVRSQFESENLSIRTVVCREIGEEFQNELLRETTTPVHGFIHGCPPVSHVHEVRRWEDRTFKADIRRLAREIGRCRIGMALSSGGALGLAHVGVIQVLEEHGIEVDMVAGCSMGSYISSIWGYGYDGHFMEKLARELEHRWGLIKLVDPLIPPRRGFMRGEKVKRRLQRSIGNVHFAELSRPVRIVATNLTSLERTVFGKGEVASAVHASSAIPGTCAPVTLGGEEYVDGGISDPLPVDVLRDMGMEKIIAVNTIPTPSYLRCRMEMEREQAEMGRRRHHNRILSVLNKYLNYFAPGNILDTILRSIHGAQMRVAEQACLKADVVLRPLSIDGRWHDFQNPGKYIQLGREETEAHIEDVKALVHAKGTLNENKTAQNTLATVA